ncbi:hypothetical protein OHC33_010496 [Knufia fluminis]|uniref:ribonuclease H n=1 Tax=Knufia fluminis TaxID=191047 RepID=A0AAN8EE56_9EURO|nr:hypothetical protein OHC33_010496 [Knufia fluminis]
MEYTPPQNTRGATGKTPCLALFCHRLIFTSGVCIGEGTTKAASGVAIVFAARRDGVQSSPILPSIDPGRNRTQARAELLAACYGLNRIRKIIQQTRGRIAAKRYIIVTDSSYVLTGMTQWVPHWRSIGRRINAAQPVDNLDLFQRLDTAISRVEQKANVMIGFCLQPPNPSTRASQFANQAATTALAKQQQAQNKFWSSIL